MSAPIIEPFKCKEFDCKQSKYEQCGKLPTRSLILAPSGGWKDNINPKLNFEYL